MIKIKVDGYDGYNEVSEELVTIRPQILFLEHSLLAVRKWEAKWHKPFLVDDEKSFDEWVDYIRCMTVNKRDVDSAIYMNLSEENFLDISKYIEDPSTATWFKKDDTETRNNQRNVTLTAEVIYYYMITFNIPVEFERWHLNQLLTLIKVFSEKNKPEKKRSFSEITSERAKINKARLEALKNGR